MNKKKVFSQRSKMLCLTLVAAFIAISLPSYAISQQLKVETELAQLEHAAGGRLGVYAINTADNTVIQYHADQRFPMCSTFKAIAVAAVLKRSTVDQNLLQQKINYQKKDLVIHSPVTEKHLSEGMTVAQLCEAAVEFSDNGATNLLLKKIGGPNAVNAFTRSINDTTFRLDRYEPLMSSALPGDLRDTTTPSAMAKSLQEITLGSTLGQTQRQLLLTWLKNNTTGDHRIRAAVPKNWQVGDKTGTGDYGTTNDIGIIWPPQRSPIVITIYFTKKEKLASSQDKVIADAAGIVMHYLES